MPKKSIQLNHKEKSNHMPKTPANTLQSTKSTTTITGKDAPTTTQLATTTDIIDDGKVDDQTQKDVSFVVDYRPSPFVFADFVPWAFKLFSREAIVIEVEKHVLEKYIPIAERSHKSARFRDDISEKTVSEDNLVTPPEEQKSKAKSPDPDDGSRKLIINAYYDIELTGPLVQIAIKGCSSVTQMLMKVIGLVIPFQAALYKVSINRCRLDQSIIYELGVILPQSNITEIVLDDTSVPQKNYYLLLDTLTQLQRLSLCRCKLGDLALVEIFKRLDYDGPHSKTLNVLELSSNMITDAGALTIATTLRRNRSLLHLNLSGNEITDQGAIEILNSLMKFNLTKKENKDRRLARKAYIKMKLRVLAKCLLDWEREHLAVQKRYKQKREQKADAKSKPKPVGAGKTPVKSIFSDEKKLEYLCKLANHWAGPFTHPYCPDQIIAEANPVVCKGNFKLCSLNLSANKLEYHFVPHLLRVLIHQADTDKHLGFTGLLRVKFDYNFIDYKSDEMKHIDMLITDAAHGLASKTHMKKSQLMK